MYMASEKLANLRQKIVTRPTLYTYYLVRVHTFSSNWITTSFLPGSRHKQWSQIFSDNVFDWLWTCDFIIRFRAWVGNFKLRESIISKSQKIWWGNTTLCSEIAKISGCWTELSKHSPDARQTWHPYYSDQPKQCFTVLPKPNQTSQLKFRFQNRNQTEPNM